MSMSFEQARVVLAQNGQVHLLDHWNRLSAVGKAGLLDQIAELDLTGLSQMRETLRSVSGKTATHTDIEPADVVELGGSELAMARSVGEEAVRKGSVAVLLVAGGQGSRLGFEGPKGEFPIGPVSNVPLFSIHARKILGLEKKYGAKVPFYVMTSQANDAETQRFFDQQQYFGLAPDRVRFFAQGMWPALWPDGRVVLDAPGHLFQSPDGHGGVLRALEQRGMFEDMRKRGIQTVFYFQVDNPLVDIADPAFVGVHLQKRADISVKVCTKRDAQEGLGVVVRKGGRDAVVEYTELTKEQKEARRSDGRLRFLYGSVAIHVFSRGFLEREAAARLPLHVAHKKVPYCDANGATAQPDKPNAYKFEKFIFDVIPDADRSVNVAFAREDEFAPVKNASGNDSPDTCRAALTAKYARWLELCGVKVPRDTAGNPGVRIELDPAFALGADDLKAKLPNGYKVAGDVWLK